MHCRLLQNLDECFRDLGIAALYALGAGLVVAMVAACDDRTLSFAWMLVDVAALPLGVILLICCEALFSTLQAPAALTDR